MIGSWLQLQILIFMLVSKFDIYQIQNNIVDPKLALDFDEDSYRFIEDEKYC